MIMFNSEAEYWFQLPLRIADPKARKEVAEDCARLIYLTHDVKPKRRALKWYRDFLMKLSEKLSSHPAHQAFIFQPDFGRMPQHFFASCHESEGDRESGIRQVIGGDADNHIDSAEPEPFVSEKLGQGMRAAYRWKDEEGQTCMTIAYGWRVDDFGVDVAVYCVGDDIDFFTGHMGDFDEFARSLYLTDV